MTARARKAIPLARAEEERIEEEWRAHLGAKRMQQLRQALTELRKITDPYQPPEHAGDRTGENP